MDISTWISVITGVCSIILAIVSLIISFVFYRWTDKTNKEMHVLSQSITEKTDYLGKLFDKMFDSTFSLVKEESEAMRNHIFNINDVGSVSEEDGVKTIDVLLFIRKGGKTFDELLKQFPILEDNLQKILNELTYKQFIYKIDDKYIVCQSDETDLYKTMTDEEIDKLWEDSTLQ